MPLRHVCWSGFKDEKHILSNCQQLIYAINCSCPADHSDDDDDNYDGDDGDDGDDDDDDVDNDDDDDDDNHYHLSAVNLCHQLWQAGLLPIPTIFVTWFNLDQLSERALDDYDDEDNGNYNDNNNVNHNHNSNNNENEIDEYDNVKIIIIIIIAWSPLVVNQLIKETAAGMRRTKVCVAFVHNNKNSKDNKKDNNNNNDDGDVMLYSQSVDMWIKEMASRRGRTKVCNIF